MKARAFDLGLDWFEKAPGRTSYIPLLSLGGFARESGKINMQPPSFRVVAKSGHKLGRLWYWSERAGKIWRTN
jgi:hypothetical protein